MSSPDLDDFRRSFWGFCDSFPIDLFGIPRPLRTLIHGNEEISDLEFALVGLSLRGVPRTAVINPKFEPIGRVNGPIYLKKESIRIGVWHLEANL
jgi:hypothetical protein